MSDKYVTVGVSAMDVAAYLAEQAIMRGLAPYGWRAVFHGWVKVGDGYRVEVQIEPPPEPEPEKPKVLCRDCTFCWDGGLCYCPALCVRAACGHIVPRPIWATNPSGNCPHRQKREEPDREE